MGKKGLVCWRPASRTASLLPASRSSTVACTGSSTRPTFEGPQEPDGHRSIHLVCVRAECGFGLRVIILATTLDIKLWQRAVPAFRCGNFQLPNEFSSFLRALPAHTHHAHTHTNSLQTPFCAKICSGKGLSKASAGSSQELLCGK